MATVFLSTKGKAWSHYPPDETRAQYVVYDTKTHQILSDGPERDYEAALARLRRHAIKTTGEHNLIVRRWELETFQKDGVSGSGIF